MGIIHVIQPCGAEHTWGASTPPEPGLLRKIIAGDIEYVSVLYKDERSYMVVNGMGAIMDPPLPVNVAATRIYHENNRQRQRRGCDIRHLGPAETWAKIHGVAVVLEGIHLE